MVAWGGARCRNRQAVLGFERVLTRTKYLPLKTMAPRIAKVNVVNRAAAGIGDIPVRRILLRPFDAEKRAKLHWKFYTVPAIQRKAL